MKASLKYDKLFVGGKYYSLDEIVKQSFNEPTHEEAYVLGNEEEITSNKIRRTELLNWLKSASFS